MNKGEHKEKWKTYRQLKKYIGMHRNPYINKKARGFVGYVNVDYMDREGCRQKWKCIDK